MAEMTRKKQVSNLMVLVVIMVLMANHFVNSEIMNIGDVGSDHHHHYHDHDGGNSVTESDDLTLHHHHNDGNRKMEVGGVNGSHYVQQIIPCKGSFCLVGQDCNDGCFCFPFFLTTGLCMGSCPSCE
ncbi:hypothetical protein FNV43_RR08625 [Rhamnella rubrinervis]|uniref:Transmembrane protein n=1 Tax=Rhamnella rubrinervis TaxID=2594499 RepID=A0A8K0H992_9ROSA|nr:hypothetical protein FNV43_RR08625 [Rhamnella rubrinervis]